MTSPSHRLPSCPSDQFLLSTLLRQSSMAIVVTDRDGIAVRIEGDVMHLLGKNQDELLGRTVEEVFENDPSHARLYRLALQGHTSRVPYLQGDRQLNICISPILDDHGGILGAFGYDSDLTAEKKLSQLQQKQEAQFLNLFNYSTDGIMLLDCNYTVQEVNPIYDQTYSNGQKLNGRICHRALFGREEPCPFCPITETYRTHKAARSYYFDPDRNKHFLLYATPLFEPETSRFIGAFETVRDVTEIYQYQETLHEQESILKNVFASIQEGMFVIDREFTILRANEAFEKMNERHRPIVGKKCYHTAGFTERCKFCPAEKTFEQGCRDTIVHPARPNPEMPEIWVEHFSYPIFGTDGAVSSAVCLIRDITQRKADEEALADYRNRLEEMVEERTRALQQSDSTMRAILSGNNTPIIFTDTQCVLTFVNAAFREITGYNEKELLGKPIWSIYDDTSRSETLSLEKAVRSRRELIEGKIDKLHRNVQIKCKDGTLRWLDMTVSSVRDAAENVTQLVAVCLDTTELHDTLEGMKREIALRQTVEEELQIDRFRMNALLELVQMTNRDDQEIVDFTIETGVKLTHSTAGYIVFFDTPGDVIPFRSRVFGEKADCFVPKMDADGTPHTLAPLLIECLSRGAAVIHDDVAAIPGSRMFPTGHFTIRSHMNLPIFDGDKAIGIIGVGNKETPYTDMDVKQLTLFAQGMGAQLVRKRNAEKLEKAKIEAEDANQAKSQFLAHMSHEIRTPLNGVIGLSDLLIGTELNAKQQEYVQLINASGKSLLFLINDILDFSKIEAGKLEIDSEPFDLPEIVESVLGILASRAGSKNLEIGFFLCRNAPRIVRGDAGRIRQILLNLVGNALKFTERGGIRVSVTIDEARETDLVLRFSVQDTGIGIPKDRLDRLFKAFSQVDASSSRVYGGTGLGLAISMKLVHLMGGSIGVESEMGQGSTFWFTVPFGCDSTILRCVRENRTECRWDGKTCAYDGGRLCTAISFREIGSEPILRNRRVLVVDDNPLQRETLRMQLESWEMNCSDCDSGDALLRMLQESEDRRPAFDVVVLDNTLADGHGVDFGKRAVEQCRQAGQAVPGIVLLRSLAEEIDSETIQALRAESIGKPITLSALFNAMMNLLFTGSATPWKSSREKELSRNSGSKKSAHAGRIHVLVVEDNRVNQIVARNLLQEAGFSCDVAINGFEGCNSIRNGRYDIVLMDCQMPEMDGYEATDLIRKWELEQGKSRLPIIALTANATKEDVQKCLDAGMDAYCSKPIDPQTVIRLIEEWYDKSLTT